MKTKNSQLIFKEFYILASSLISIPLEDESDGLINDFSIDIDFDIYKSEEIENEFRIIVSIDGNDDENPTPGYCFGIIIEGYFGFDFDKKNDQNEIDVLLTRSAIPILIGQLRNYLSTITAMSPYGKYILPSIDMNDLLEQKDKMEHSEHD